MQVTDIVAMLGEHEEGSFVDFASLNDKPFGACRVTGVSPVWEMHPDTDEFFYVIEGQMEITLLEDDAARQYVAAAGSAFVVPRGVWHKPGAPDGATFFYHTPGESLHSDKDDPREL